MDFNPYVRLQTVLNRSMTSVLNAVFTPRMCNAFMKAVPLNDNEAWRSMIRERSCTPQAGTTAHVAAVHAGRKKEPNS